GLVGKCPARQLARAARTVPQLPHLDWLAASADGVGARGAVGGFRVAVAGTGFVVGFAPGLLRSRARRWEFHLLLAADCLGRTRCRTSLAPRLAYPARHSSGLHIL